MVLNVFVEQEIFIMKQTTRYHPNFKFQSGLIEERNCTILLQWITKVIKSLCIARL